MIPEECIQCVVVFVAREVEVLLGAAIAMPQIVGLQIVSQSLVGDGLQFAVDSGVDVKAGGVGVIAISIEHFGPDHFGDIGRVGLGLGGMQ